MPPHVAAADQHDVARARRRALVSERLFELGGGDLVARDGGGRVAVFVLVPAELVIEVCVSCGLWWVGGKRREENLPSRLARRGRRCRRVRTICGCRSWSF